MGELKKATLVKIASDDSGKELDKPVAVQFNPTTMKLQISSNLAKGSPAGSQQRQSTGSSSTSLTLDLVFDTADEGTTEKPRSVREKTALVEQFVVPDTKTQGKQKPPKVRFQWGSFFIDGVMASVNIDFDLFASDGTPLRAKVAVTIQEQNSKYIFLKAGAGANQKGNAPEPGKPSAGTLGTGGGPSNQVAPALGGESLPEFATRQGLDPQAWRGLSTDFGGGLSGELTLQAGEEVGFTADLTTSTGVGVSLGVEAGLSASLEASFGLQASATVAGAGIGTAGELAAGFLLSAAGGVGAALASVRNAKSDAASQQARQAFGRAPGNAPSPAASARPTMPEQDHTPLVVSGIPSLSRQLQAPAAPALRQVDARAASFGFGVPLRPSVGPALDERAASLSGHVSLVKQVGTGLPPVAVDPTTPPWVMLPKQAGTRTAIKGKPDKPCSCGGAHPH